MLHAKKMMNIDAVVSVLFSLHILLFSLDKIVLIHSLEIGSVNVWLPESFKNLSVERISGDNIKS